MFTIDSSAAGYKDDDPRLVQMFSTVETNVKSIPGVTGAAFSFFVFNQGGWGSAAFVIGEEPIDDARHQIKNNVVSPDYFNAMGIPLILGRGFGPSDTAKSQKVAVISETMAQRFFPNTSPLGKRFAITRRANNDIEVVGVAKDAKYGTLAEEFRPMAYYPLEQRSQALSNFIVRFSGSPDSLVPQIRQTIKQVNRNLPIDDVVSLQDHIGRSLVRQKLVARLASVFGLVALLLACVGLYGVMSYAVARRTNEIGIRMALGAQRTNVLWLVLREVLLLVGIGLVIGLGASLATTKTASTLLFGLKPNDPLTITLASILLVVIALLAGYLPARRAARVDPMLALRDE